MGRMHQIRVHAAHSGHPILGDEVYGKRTLNRELKKQGLKRLFLHAHTLNFMLPSTMKKISVSAPLSPELEKFLNSLENGSNNEQ
jgi:23S rRNA pseudouridine955/2504/2580 synthase